MLSSEIHGTYRRSLTILVVTSARADLWTDAAVLGHPRWLEVRERAREVQRLLGWNAGNVSNREDR